jgi:hypothetical protein
MMVRGSWPSSASSINCESKSASLDACVLMIIDKGSACAATPVSKASKSALRGPRT